MTKPAGIAERRSCSQRIQFLGQLLLVIGKVSEQLNLVSHDSHPIARAKTIHKYLSCFHTRSDKTTLAKAVVNNENYRAWYRRAIASRKSSNMLLLPVLGYDDVLFIQSR